MTNNEINKIRNAFELISIELKQSKISRIIKRPFKYAFVYLVRLLASMSIIKGVKTTTSLFFETSFKIILPSSIDIYLFGCGADDSDVALAHYLLKLEDDIDTFIDVEANYGFFTLLMCKIKGPGIALYAFEPSGSAFEILEENCKAISNCKRSNEAVGERSGYTFIYEFPVRYSEYNTPKLDQYLERSKWINKNKPKEVKVNMIKLDDLHLNTSADILVKIDAEGYSSEIVSGALNVIEKYRPIFILRYWNNSRNNRNQIAAIELLIKENYDLFTLSRDGSLSNLYGDVEKLKSYYLENVILKPKLT